MSATTTAHLPDGTKAQRVYLSLRDQIAEGQYSRGETLPGEQRLAAMFAVSRVTIRRALDALAQDGLVDRVAGSGTKVTGAKIAAKASMNFNTLMPQLVEMGQKTTARLLSFSYDAPPAAIAQALQLDPNEKTQIATRVRLSGDVPFSHLTTYVPAAIAQNYSENDLATTPLFKLLERGGVQIKDARQSVSATLASPEVAEALDVAVGSALLSLRRVVRDVDGNGVEYLSGLYRPDMFRLEMPLERVGEGPARHWEPAIGSTKEGDT